MVEHLQSLISILNYIHNLDNANFKHNAKGEAADTHPKIRQTYPRSPRPACYAPGFPFVAPNGKPQ
jgi:hypothetical protein